MYAMLEQCSLLDMLEVLRAPRPPVPTGSESKHSMLAFPWWPMAYALFSQPLPRPPLAKCCGKLCVFCHVFISRHSFFFLLFFFLFLSPISLPVYLHSRSFCFVSFFLVPDTTLALALATAPALAPAQLALSFSNAVARGSWVAYLARPTPTPNAHVSFVVCFILFAFVYK